MVPVAIPILPIAILLLLQLPPPASLSVTADEPTHTGMLPDMAAGRAVTFIVVVIEQPPVAVYMIVADPAVTGVTTPPAFTFAIAVLLLTQLLAGVVASYRLVVDPRHTVVVPVIAAGNGLTTIFTVLAQPVPSV